jgi:general secretion pathway protein F
MPIFSYKGFDAQTGADIKGKIDAESERAARTTLRQKRKIIVAQLKEEKPNSSSKSSQSFSLFQQKVGLSELCVMVRQFATLQGAHVPLDESLKALVSQSENSALRNTLSAIKDSVSEGKSLADASAAFPGIFNRLYVNMVRAGESSGTLSTVLQRLADFLEYQVQVRGKVMQAMIYPAIMIFASLSIIAFLLVVIVPKLKKVFDSLRVTVPWYTEAMISFSNFAQNYWYVFIVGFALSYFIFKAWISSAKGRRSWDSFMLRAPLFGPVMLMVSVSRFTKTLSTLLSSGVNLIPALEITKNVVNNVILSEVIEQAKIEVQEGNSLASCISRSGVFPGLVTHMIATGERTGELEQMLAHVARAYDIEVEQKIAKMISLIEPIMMLLLMVIAVTVIVGMVMPMMDVMKQVR